MSLNAIQRSLLDLLVEDDYGLWELLWKVGQDYPEVAAGARQAVELELTQLAGRGFVEIYEADLDAGHRKRREGVASLSELENPDRWQEPKEGDVALFVSATRAGEAAFYGPVCREG
jgi:hypothetical protein